MTVNRNSSDTSDLPDKFFADWVSAMNWLGIDPLFTLMVSNNESIGVDPTAYNPLGAGGLIQFTQVAMPGIGFHGTPADMTKLSAVDQVPYVEAYFKPWAQYITSPAMAYMVNAAPAYVKAAAAANSLDYVLPQEIYGGNSGFDTQHKGYITLGDLNRAMYTSASGARWDSLFSRLNSAVVAADKTPTDVNTFAQERAEAMVVPKIGPTPAIQAQLAQKLGASTQANAGITSSPTAKYAWIGVLSIALGYGAWKYGPSIYRRASKTVSPLLAKISGKKVEA